MVQRIANFLEQLGKHGTDKWFIGGKRRIERKKGENYLWRYYLLSTPYLGIYIHQFHAPDYPVLHSHPWEFVSIVLKGEYLEHLPDGTVEHRKTGSFRFRKAEEFHWIDLLGETGSCWTLFIRFKPRREWGFLTSHGWVHWTRYDAEIQRLRDEQNHS